MKKYFAVIVIALVMMFVTEMFIDYSHESAHVAVYHDFNCDSQINYEYGFMPAETEVIGPCRYNVEIAQSQANVEAIGYHVKALNTSLWMLFMVSFLLFFVKDDCERFRKESGVV